MLELAWDSIYQRNIWGDLVGFFDLDKFLPLEEEGRPEGIITLEGVKSYKEFAEKEIPKFHQHGMVSPLMSVFDIESKTAQMFSLASENFGMESYAVPSGVVSENYGQMVTPNPEPDWMITEQLSELKNAFPQVSIKIPLNKLIGSSSLMSLSPLGV